MSKQNKQRVKRLSHVERAERRKRITADLANGMTRQKAMQKYGVSYPTVEHCGPATGAGRIKRRSFEMLADMLLKGQSKAEVARKYGVTDQCVQQLEAKALAAGFKRRCGAAPFKRAKS